MKRPWWDLLSATPHPASTLCRFDASNVSGGQYLSGAMLSHVAQIVQMCTIIWDGINAPSWCDRQGHHLRTAKQRYSPGTKTAQKVVETFRCSINLWTHGGSWVIPPTPPKVSVRLQHHSNPTHSPHFATFRHISPHFATMLWHAFSSSRRRSSSSCASNCPLWSDLISWAWCIGIGHGVDTGGDRWVVVPCHSLVIVMIVTYWYILLSYCHIVRYLNGKGWIWLEYDYHDRTGYIMWHTRWRWHNTSNYPGANLPNTLTASASIRASSSLSWSRHRFASSNLSRFKPAVMWQLSVPQTYIHCRSAHFARDGFNISSYHLI